MPEKVRLIINPPSPAVFNMAADEILMESQSSLTAKPVLRIYSWSSPAYSIGYFQKVEEIVKRFDCRKKKIPVVRRITGGGLVFHGSDLTFSLSLKDPNKFFAGDVKTSYLKINEALLAGFQELEPKTDFADCRNIPSGRGSEDRVCFDNPSCYDLLLNGKKIVGSSQRRKDGAILHQCSVFLKKEKELLIKKILGGFQKKWNVVFEEEPLSAAEQVRVREKAKARYSLGDWAFLESSFLS